MEEQGRKLEQLVSRLKESEGKKEEVEVREEGKKARGSRGGGEGGRVRGKREPSRGRNKRNEQ